MSVRRTMGTRSTVRMRQVSEFVRNQAKFSSSEILISAGKPRRSATEGYASWDLGFELPCI
jgi:hypothetical protein